MITKISSMTRETNSKSALASTIKSQAVTVFTSIHQNYEGERHRAAFAASALYSIGSSSYVSMARITMESRSNLAQIPRGSNAISTYLARYSDAFLAPVQLRACKAL